MTENNNSKDPVLHNPEPGMGWCRGDNKWNTLEIWVNEVSPGGSIVCRIYQQTFLFNLTRKSGRWIRQLSDKEAKPLNTTFFEWSLALKLAEPETPVRVCHSLVPQADAS